MWRRAFTGLEIVMTGLVVAGLAAGLVLVKQNQNLNKLAACTPGQTSNQGCGANGCPTDSERVCECLSNGSWSCGCYAAANCAPTPAPTTPPTGDSCKPNGNSAGYCDGHNPGDNIGPCTCQFSSLGGGDCWCPSNLTCEQAGGTCYSGTTCSGQTPPRVVVNGGGGCNSGVCCGGASGGTTTAPTMPPAGATKTPTPGGSGACADAGGKCVGNGENCNYSDYGQKDCGLGYKCVPEMATCTTTPPTRSPSPTPVKCPANEFCVTYTNSCSTIGYKSGVGKCSGGICCSDPIEPTVTNTPKPIVTSTPKLVPTNTSKPTPTNTKVPTPTNSPTPRVGEKCESTKAGKCVSCQTGTVNYGQMDCLSGQVCVPETASCTQPTVTSGATKAGSGSITQQPQVVTNTPIPNNKVAEVSKAPSTIRTATLSEVSGEVKVCRQNGSCEIATVGTVIGPGDKVITGESGAKARVDVSDGSILRLTGNTDFQLATAKVSQIDGSVVTQLKLLLGELWVAFVGGPMEIETPENVATVRGTVFGVSVDKARGTSIVVTEGVVTSRANGSLTDVAVSANQMLIIPARQQANSTPVVNKAVDVDKKPTWVSDNLVADQKIATVIEQRKDQKAAKVVEQPKVVSRQAKVDESVWQIVVARLILSGLWLFGK